MPYIQAADREFWNEKTKELEGYLSLEQSWTPGDLNYVITRLLLATGPARYEDFNTLVGVLECVKAELYRRAVAPYEDRKIAENGDVYA